MAMALPSERVRTRILAAPEAKGFPKFKERIGSKLHAQLHKFKKTQDIGDLSLGLRKTLDDAYDKAYRIGASTDKISKKEEKWIDEVRAEQYEYLDGFLSDLDAGRSRMDPGQRLDMYVKKLDAMYWSGAVKSLEGNTEIDWLLGSTDSSCEDCIELASNSPYGPDELHTVPGAGDTDCIANCMCSLSVRD